MRGLKGFFLALRQFVSFSDRCRSLISRALCVTLRNDKQGKAKDVLQKRTTTQSRIFARVARSGCSRRVGQADSDTVNAAVGAGKDFEAKAFFFDHLAGKRDVASDLGDEAAEGGGLVVFR